MDFKFDLMTEVVITGTRRSGVIIDRKESDDTPGIAIYTVIEPTLKAFSWYEDEIVLRSRDSETASTESA